MGYSRKSEIESRRLDKRKAKADKKRNEGTRSQIVRFLIVCEGKKTEPNYFRSIERYHASDIMEVDIEGKGMSTVPLVDKTKELKEDLERKRATEFDRTWIVFDKDDFEDFNEAIRMAKGYGFRCAWSNEAFELWYYLHFEYLDAGVGRKDYISKLETVIRKSSSNSNFVYEKGDPYIYKLLQTYGNEELAKQRAAKLRNLFKGSSDYAAHKPCTLVDLLVEELEHPEKVLSGELR